MSKVLNAVVAAASLSIALGGASLASAAGTAGAATKPATSGGCTPTTVPKISSISAVAAIEQTQTITIKGSCFGSGNTFTTSDNEWLQIIDKPGSWSACHVSSYPENDTVTCTVTKWTNSKIVFTGFSGDYGNFNYTLQSGDHLLFCVWNLSASDTAKRNNAGKKSITVS
jgi:hypothetical protein